MHKATFYPLGNADTCLIDLDDGSKMLFDYAHCKDGKDEDDLRIDLADALTSDLKKDDVSGYKVVAFTHADDDHIRGFSDFFYLEHAKKYQDDERVKIKELWVPSAVLVDKDLKGEAKILKAEAKYRFKEKKRIKIFSRPDKLKEWAEEEGIDLDERSHLIIDAGQYVPGYSKEDDGVEFFVHSPFVKNHEGEAIVRNACSLVVQLNFLFSDVETKLLLGSDTPYDVWQDIVNITKKHKNNSTLEWDIVKLPHHCSYTSLSDEKGKDKTEPVKEVKWLYEQGSQNSVIVSSSNPIVYEDTDQPPHFQAANYYEDVAKDKDGEFKVTMTHPRKTDPKPLVITIDGDGATLKKATILGGSSAVITQQAPRAGK